jgi:hypothetical protein
MITDKLSLESGTYLLVMSADQQKEKLEVEGK